MKNENLKNNLTQTQISCMTSFTRDGTVDMKNKKPYRTPKQKIEAQSSAKKSQGRWISSAPVSYH